MNGEELLNLVEDGEWKGMAQWKCTLCAFDSVESKDAVIAHILKVHMPGAKADRAQGRPILVDAKGNPLISAAPGIEVVDAADKPPEEDPGEDGNDWLTAGTGANDDDERN